LAERPPLVSSNDEGQTDRRPIMKRGPKPKPVVEFPELSTEDWVDPPTFPETLALHMRWHGEPSRLSGTG